MFQNSTQHDMILLIWLSKSGFTIGWSLDSLNCSITANMVVKHVWETYVAEEVTLPLILDHGTDCIGLLKKGGKMVFRICHEVFDRFSNGFCSEFSSKFSNWNNYFQIPSEFTNWASFPIFHMGSKINMCPSVRPSVCLSVSALQGLFTNRFSWK